MENTRNPVWLVFFDLQDSSSPLQHRVDRMHWAFRLNGSEAPEESRAGYGRRKQKTVNPWEVSSCHKPCKCIELVPAGKLFLEVWVSNLEIAL